MPNLPIGPYRLEVSLQGFRTYVQTGIVLQVDARPTINAVLAVGNLEETVSVEAAAPLVDVRSAGISTVVEQERIVELPLQGRQVTDLIVLAGAAVETGRPNSRNFQGGVNISVAGGLQFGVAYTLDGAVHNDPQNSASLPLPFPDALQEFRVATSGLTAQSGMRSAASVNAVTKSGTNTLHGNLFEFVRRGRSRRKEVRRWLEAQSVRWHRWWTDYPRQDVLLRRISGHANASDAAGPHCLCSDRRDAGRRLHDVRLRCMPGAPGEPRRGLCRQS